MNDEPFETRLHATWQELQQSPDQFFCNAWRLLMMGGACIFAATSFYHLLCVCMGTLLGLRIWNGIDEFPAALYPYAISLTILPSVFISNPFKRFWRPPDTDRIESKKPPPNIR